jgi:hypothetical protein
MEGFIGDLCIKRVSPQPASAFEHSLGLVGEDDSLGIEGANDFCGIEEHGVEAGIHCVAEIMVTYIR